MPNYTVQCVKCNGSRTVFRSLSEHGQWPQCCGGLMVQILTPLQIMPDIQPYKAVAVDVATGKAPIIRSRTEHKQFLKRNGYVEVGTEQPKPKKPEYELTDGRDIKRAIDEVKSRRGL